MWPNCVARVHRVHAGLRRSEREGQESRDFSSVLDARGDCFIASCVTAWVHAGPAQVPCRFRRQYCLRGGEAIPGLAGPFYAARVPRTLFGLRVHEEAMWSNCVARVHAGPRRSEREGLESRGKSSVGRAW